MKKYSLKSIMHSAWSIYRKVEGITFGDALRMAWANARAYNEANLISAADFHTPLCTPDTIFSDYFGWYIKVNNVQFSFL